MKREMKPLVAIEARRSGVNSFRVPERNVTSSTYVMNDINGMYKSVVVSIPALIPSVPTVLLVMMFLFWGFAELLNV